VTIGDQSSALRRRLQLVQLGIDALKVADFLNAGPAKRREALRRPEGRGAMLQEIKELEAD
jgi:hypothetical protein